MRKTGVLHRHECSGGASIVKELTCLKIAVDGTCCLPCCPLLICCFPSRRCHGRTACPPDTDVPCSAAVAGQYCYEGEHADQCTVCYGPPSNGRSHMPELHPQAQTAPHPQGQTMDRGSARVLPAKPACPVSKELAQHRWRREKTAAAAAQRMAANSQRPNNNRIEAAGEVVCPGPGRL